MGIERKNLKSFYERLSVLDGTVQRVTGHGSSDEHVIEVTPQSGIISIKELDGGGKLISKWELGEDSVLRATPIDLEAESGSTTKTMGEEAIHTKIELMLANLARYESHKSE